MMIKSILILTVLSALVPTAMSNVSASSDSEIALFSTASSDSNGLTISGNGDSARMELKATNDDGKSKRVSGFQLTADNVLSTEVGDKVTVIDNVDFTKAVTTDGKNNQKAIGITSNGVIDFTGYTQGVYTLDVVVDDDRAYEAIIAIGDQTNQIVDKEITRINSDYTLKFIIDYDCDKGYHYENGKCAPDKPKPIKCDEGQKLIDGKCKPIGNPYCDLVPDNYKGTCHDRKDCSEDTLLCSCRDGSKVEDWRDCKDAGKHQDEQLKQMMCPAHVGGCEDLVPIDEPEPIDCDDGEELVDGQCQLITMNLVEPVDPLLIDENSDDQSIIGDDDPDESEDDGQGESGGDDSEDSEESGGDDSEDSEESGGDDSEGSEESGESESEEQSSGN